MNANLSWPESDDDWYRFLQTTGLTTDTARKALLFGYYAEYYGLPKLVLSSGRRDAAWVKAAQARWDRGDRAGLLVRPATNSDHNTGNAFDWKVELGKLNASQLQLAGKIGKAVGLTWGGEFKTPDPYHFSNR